MIKRSNNLPMKSLSLLCFTNKDIKCLIKWKIVNVNVKNEFDSIFEFNDKQ